MGRFVIACIDDILIYSLGLEEHINYVKNVLSLQFKNYVKVRFQVTQISLLEYIFSPEGVAMGKDKDSTVTTWFTSTMVKEL